MIKQCVFKQPIHYGHISGIPLAEVLIERYCILEGCFHICRTCGDPASDVLIKGGGIVKRRFKCRNIGGIPIFYVTIKRVSGLEHA